MSGKKQAPAVSAPDRIGSYFIKEKWPLLIVTVTGIIYNAGMTAGPWFEGQLAQMLCNIMGGSGTAAQMLSLALTYVAVILLVQAMRYAKRFYVRRFGNDIAYSMKHTLYRNLVHMGRAEQEHESVGSVMTKAISDVDTCAEGMRKFTTEVFDTGVVMVAYLVMLAAYDWRLTIIACIFPPFAYIIAERLKKTVSRCASAYKESAGRLNGATLDRVSGALTYRILGGEGERDGAYEERLADYEKKAVRAGILETTMQPLYQIISMLSVVFIIWLGAKNVAGTGWSSWNIAAFTTFISCFAKLALKSSKAAKLFNAVQKARVSWERIKPLMKNLPADGPVKAAAPAELEVKKLSFAYPGGGNVIADVSFDARPGEITGITGQVACGKSTLGKAFLCETPYKGSIRFGGRELGNMQVGELCGAVAYMGHAPELLSATIAENILLGDDGDAWQWLRAVCMDDEVRQMPDGIDTRVGSGGVRLSGGQQARIALARTLCHKRPVLVLDDPFSALDRNTEKQAMANLRAHTRDCIVLLISHRLYEFPHTDRVLWMENGHATVSTHERLYHDNAEYRNLYNTQTGEAEA